MISHEERIAYSDTDIGEYALCASGEDARAKIDELYTGIRNAWWGYRVVLSEEILSWRNIPVSLRGRLTGRALRGLKLVQAYYSAPPDYMGGRYAFCYAWETDEVSPDRPPKLRARTHGKVVGGGKTIGNNPDEWWNPLYRYTTCPQTMASYLAYHAGLLTCPPVLVVEGREFWHDPENGYLVVGDNLLQSLMLHREGETIADINVGKCHEDVTLFPAARPREGGGYLLYVHGPPWGQCLGWVSYRVAPTPADAVAYYRSRHALAEFLKRNPAKCPTDVFITIGDAERAGDKYGTYKEEFSRFIRDRNQPNWRIPISEFGPYISTPGRAFMWGWVAEACFRQGHSLGQNITNQKGASH
jgi:hypothetical protein